MKIEFLDDGRAYVDFVDAEGTKACLYESQAAPNRLVLDMFRMDKEQAEQLIPLLQCFVKTGRLPRENKAGEE